MQHQTQAHPATATRSATRRRLSLTLVALVMFGAMLMGTAETASAGGTARAHSNSMECNATYGWARTNYPNIMVGTVQNQNVYS
jgi:hypothetical protein